MAGQQLRPIAGDGLLARFGDLVLLCAVAPAYQAQIGEVLDLVTGVADGGGDGRRVSRRLAGLLLSDEDDPVEYPPLAVLGPLGDGLAVFVHGGAVVEVEGADGLERLDGTQTVTWVDRRVRGPVFGVRAMLAGTPKGEPDQWCRLDSGIVRAGGFVWTAAETRADTTPAVTPVRAALPEPARGDAGPSAEPAARRSSVGLAAPAAPPTARAALGVHAMAPAPAPEPAERANGSEEPEPGPRLTLLRNAGAGEIVTGCFCADGHFNAVADDSCRDCGAELAQPPARTATGSRPVLGVLAVDGGPRLPLDRPYVVGRDPGADEDVDAGRAKPLRLTDIDGRIAPVHARVEPHGWEIHVIDFGTPGGTHYCAPDATDWSRVMPNVPTAVALGGKVLFGRTGVRVERVDEAEPEN